MSVEDDYAKASNALMWYDMVWRDEAQRNARQRDVDREIWEKGRERERMAGSGRCS